MLQLLAPAWCVCVCVCVYCCCCCCWTGMGSEEVSRNSRHLEKAMMGPKKTSHWAARPTTVPAHSPLFEDDMVLLDFRLDPSQSCVIAQKPSGMRERGGGLALIIACSSDTGFIRPLEMYCNCLGIQGEEVGPPGVAIPVGERLSNFSPMHARYVCICMYLRCHQRCHACICPFRYFRPCVALSA